MVMCDFVDYKMFKSDSYSLFGQTNFQTKHISRDGVVCAVTAPSRWNGPHTAHYNLDLGESSWPPAKSGLITPSSNSCAGARRRPV